MFGLVGSALVIAQMAALSLGLPLHLAFSVSYTHLTLPTIYSV